MPESRATVMSANVTDSSRTGPWHVCLSARPAANWRLVCFPHAGAGPGAYLAWPKHLPDDIEVHSVLLPGRSQRLREPPEMNLERLLAGLAPALRSLADRPIALFGHSLGGLLAFEVARAWRAGGGLQPAHLFVSAAPAPQLARDRSPVSALPDVEFLAALRKFGGTPPKILAHAELMELVLPALRADFALDERYQYWPGAPLDVPITVMGGAADPCVRSAALAAWRSQTRAECTVKTFPGEHFYIEAQVKAVLALIVRQMRAANRTPAAPPNP